MTRGTGLPFPSWSVAIAVSLFNYSITQLINHYETQ
jgi:hypothetical protein